jgi:hypothetical protein
MFRGNIAALPDAVMLAESAITPAAGHTSTFRSDCSAKKSGVTFNRNAAFAARVNTLSNNIMHEEVFGVLRIF